MGATRKALSICTLGLIDFWSDKERTARNTKATAREAKRQTAILRDASRAARRDGLR